MSLVFSIAAACLTSRLARRGSRAGPSRTVRVVGTVTGPVELSARDPERLPRLPCSGAVDLNEHLVELLLGHRSTHEAGPEPRAVGGSARSSRTFRPVDRITWRRASPRGAPSVCPGLRRPGRVGYGRGGRLRSGTRTLGPRSGAGGDCPWAHGAPPPRSGCRRDIGPHRVGHRSGGGSRRRGSRSLPLRRSSTGVLRFRGPP